MTFDECIENIVSDGGDARYYVSLLIQEALDKVVDKISNESSRYYNRFNPDEILSFIETLKHEYCDNS